MIDLKYSLVIEATADPTFFGFFSPDLEGFTGIGPAVRRWFSSVPNVLTADTVAFDDPGYPAANSDFVALVDVCKSLKSSVSSDVGVFTPTRHVS